ASRAAAATARVAVAGPDDVRARLTSRPTPCPSHPRASPAPTRKCSTMRAVGILEYGGPDVVEVNDRDRPAAARGDQRFRVAVAAVIPTDLMLRSGLLDAYPSAVEPPHVPGIDVSGTVAAAGAGTLFALGDRVMASVDPFRPQGGAQAEYAVVSAADTVLVPPGLDLVVAAG